MKKYYKLIITLFVISFLVPQVVLASWWNPFSWFGSKNSSPVETGTQAQQTIQDASDQSAIIEQLNKIIAELEKQLAEYKCPTCVSGTTQCPECKPQIINKETIVEKLVPTTCQTCPACETPQTTTKTPTPLMAYCSVKFDTDIRNRPITFTIEPQGGVGDGVYYYTWKDTKYIKLSHCGTTVNPTCSIYPPYTTTGNVGEAVLEVRSGDQKITIYCPALSI